MRFVTQGLNKDNKKLIYSWLFYAVSSLIFAGIFAFLVAMARTPVIQDILPGKNYIHVALVGHVILSVVIWFLAFQGVLWILSSTELLNTQIFNKTTGWVGFWFSVAGTICIVITALFGLGTPLFINYIPVLTHPLFYTGLLLLAVGISVTLAVTFLSIWKSLRQKTYTGRFSIITFGMSMSAISVFFAIICFGLSYYFQVSGPKRDSLDFESLFWGGGHILQFANTIAMVTVWIFLTNLIFKTIPIKDGYGKALYIFYLFFVLPSPFLYFIYDTTTQEYRDAFTRLMQYGLGPSTGLFTIALLVTIKSKGSENISKELIGFISKIKGLPWKDPAFSSLVISMIVFTLGGIISLTIYGSDTRIPSHYHGVIGGVTLAFMGLTNHILSILNKDIYSKKIATLQPYIYGIGQALFVIGMFLAGAHGVQRKTFGSAQNLDDISKIIGMSIVGLGGLIAIIGGIMFVTNSILSLIGDRKEA